MDDTGLSSRLVANYYHILLERSGMLIPLAAIYTNAHFRKDRTINFLIVHWRVFMQVINSATLIVYSCKTKLHRISVGLLVSCL